MKLTLEEGMRFGMLVIVIITGLFFIIYGIATGEFFFGILWGLFWGGVIWLVQVFVRLTVRYIVNRFTR